MIWLPLPLLLLAGLLVAARGFLARRLAAVAEDAPGFRRDLCGWLRRGLAEDGRWGEQTLAAANAAEEHALVAAFVEVRVEHYRRIASSDAGKAQYLAAWVARARR